MKKFVFILLPALISILGCSSSPKLTKEEAIQILNKELNYPKVVDFDIYCSDPAFVQKLSDAGLETSGLVILQKMQKLKDAGSPLISFTEKAQPYLLPTPEKDKAIDIQKVKIANEEIDDVQISPDSEDKNSVWVEYTSVFKNVTPFSVLLKKDLGKPVSNKSRLTFKDKRWVIKFKNSF